MPDDEADDDQAGDDKADDDKADSQPVKERTGCSQIGLWRGWGRFVRHFVLLPRKQRSLKWS